MNRELRPEPKKASETQVFMPDDRSSSNHYLTTYEKKKPLDFQGFHGGAYEARSHTHALKALKFEEVEHTIHFHLTTLLTTMRISEGASSQKLVRTYKLIFQ
jgi:hypothetical protein